MNRVILSGWIQFDPEVKVVGGKGISMMQNVISVKDKFRGADGKYKYHNVRFKAYRNQADFIKNYLHKGDKILIEGALEVYRPEQGREIVSVIVSDVELLEAKRTATKESYNTLEGFTEVIEGDEPF